MAIDVKEFIKNKTMKMSPEDIRRVVSNYISKLNSK